MGPPEIDATYRSSRKRSTGTGANSPLQGRTRPMTGTRLFEVCDGHARQCAVTSAVKAERDRPPAFGRPAVRSARRRRQSVRTARHVWPPASVGEIDTIARRATAKSSLSPLQLMCVSITRWSTSESTVPVVVAGTPGAASGVEQPPVSKSSSTRCESRRRALGSGGIGAVLSSVRGSTDVTSPATCPMSLVGWSDAHPIAPAAIVARAAARAAVPYRSADNDRPPVADWMDQRWKNRFTHSRSLADESLESLPGTLAGHTELLADRSPRETGAVGR